LLVQPIIGYMSDRTWHPWLGQSSPVLSSSVPSSAPSRLFLMPHSARPLDGCGLLWVLDVFGNVAMEPFRAFVADKLPDSQLNRGFVMQSLMIGLGGSIASALPWLLSQLVPHGKYRLSKGVIPENVQYSFYLGALLFCRRCSRIPFSRQRNTHPLRFPLKKRSRNRTRDSAAASGRSFHSIVNMPPKMRSHRTGAILYLARPFPDVVLLRYGRCL
jgi:maltose/moltooligosaccharide transporter